jgi:hypothetical protein
MYDKVRACYGSLFHKNNTGKFSFQLTLKEYIIMKYKIGQLYYLIQLEMSPVLAQHNTQGC